MSDLVFNSAKTAASDEPLLFTLDGIDYKFTPPKRSAMFASWLFESSLAEQMRVQLNWLSAGLSDEDANRIKTRLLDPEDALEVRVVIDIVVALTEEMAGRPTTPSGE